MSLQRCQLARRCVLMAGLLLPGLATAQAVCPEESTLAAYPPVVSVRVDNDLFANQDQGYTSGVMPSMVSPNLKD